MQHSRIIQILTEIHPFSKCLFCKALSPLVPNTCPSLTGTLQQNYKLKDIFVNKSKGEISEYKL